MISALITATFAQPPLTVCVQTLWAAVLHKPLDTGCPTAVASESWGAGHGAGYGINYLLVDITLHISRDTVVPTVLATFC